MVKELPSNYMNEMSNRGYYYFAGFLRSRMIIPMSTTGELMK